MDFQPLNQRFLNYGGFLQDRRLIMPNERIGYFQAYGDMWRRYADFQGRTNTAGFWKAYLFASIVSFAYAVFILYNLAETTDGRFDLSGYYSSYWSMGYLLGTTLFMVYCLATLVPTLAIIVRRLRDSGQSPYWVIAFLLIPVAGYIMMIVMLQRPSAQSPSVAWSQFPYAQQLYGNAPYGQSAQPPYGQPAQPPYGQSPQTHYGQPPRDWDTPYAQPSLHGQPMSSYGQPQQYGQQAQYGQQGVPHPPFGQGSQPKYGQHPYGQASQYGQYSHALVPQRYDKAMLAVILCVILWVASCIVSASISYYYVRGLLVSMNGIGANSYEDIDNNDDWSYDDWLGDDDDLYGYDEDDLYGYGENWTDDLTEEELAAIDFVQNGFVGGYADFSVAEVIACHMYDLDWYIWDDGYGIYYISVDGWSLIDGEYAYAEFCLDGEGRITVYNVSEGDLDAYAEEAEQMYSDWYRVAGGQGDLTGTDGAAA
jgi:uncharacterized membrane protein YhaH (DUF805 family)